MEIELVEITTEHAKVLDALMELYQYDFTEFTAEDVGADGRVGNDMVARYCGGDRVRSGLLLRIDEQWAGLTLLHRGAFSIEDEECMDIVEFFVMRKYRRHGAGEAMARAVFDRYPGRWEVRMLANNLPAQSFWRATIGRYASGQFDEHQWDDEKWRGPIISFDNSRA